MEVKNLDIDNANSEIYDHQMSLRTTLERVHWSELLRNLDRGEHESNVGEKCRLGISIDTLQAVTWKQDRLTADEPSVQAALVAAHVRHQGSASAIRSQNRRHAPSAADQPQPESRVKNDAHAWLHPSRSRRFALSKLAMTDLPAGADQTDETGKGKKHSDNL